MKNSRGGGGGGRLPPILLQPIVPLSFYGFYHTTTYVLCAGIQAFQIRSIQLQRVIVPLGESLLLYDEQGAVHARVSCNFGKEFGCLITSSLRFFNKKIINNFENTNYFHKISREVIAVPLKKPD